MVQIPSEVIGRYAYKKSISYSEALSIFSELECFLEKASALPLSPSEAIDKAWHEFILHTKLYEEYCKKHYGKLIHHIPTSPMLNEEDEAIALELVNDCRACQSAPPGTSCRTPN